MLSTFKCNLLNYNNKKLDEKSRISMKPLKSFAAGKSCLSPYKIHI